MRSYKILGFGLIILGFLCGDRLARGQTTELINASYDPTREMYAAYNPIFEKFWKDKTGQEVKIVQSHGPSGKQARDIIAGKEADVASLSVDFDIDQIAKAGQIDSKWRERFPNASVPYSSAVVFLVRAGNPKNIKDWEDLARDDVEGLAPDPKTGGGARWIYLSAWSHAVRKAKAAGKNDADAESEARAFTSKVYDQAITDPAMRGSTTRFIQQETGDVLFGWENEILQIVNDPRRGAEFEIVVPSDSIEIEVPIAVVDKQVEKRNTKVVAEAYVQFLFSNEGQELVAKFYNRPFEPEILKKHAAQFPPLTLYKFKDYFTDWDAVQKAHFAQGGELDKMRGK